MDHEHVGSHRVTRRRMLAGTVAGFTAGLAGCATLPGDEVDGEPSPGTPTFRRLGETTLHVAAGVDLTVPDRVETVSEPDGADLVVLPDDSDVDAGRAADWLTAGRVVALLGEAAQATWLDWVQSDAFHEAFPSGEHAEAEPAPQLLVGVADDDRVSTYRHTWGNGHSDRDVLEALDEVLVDLAEETPRE